MNRHENSNMCVYGRVKAGGKAAAGCKRGADVQKAGIMESES